MVLGLNYVSDKSANFRA